MSTAINVSRHGGRLHLSFPEDQGLDLSVRSFPYAERDESRGWSVALCAESVSVLRDWERQGLVATDMSKLLGPAIEAPGCHDGVLLPGTAKYPFTVWQAWHHGPSVRDMMRSRGYRVGESDKFRFPPTSAGALVSLVKDGVIGDPHGVLPRAEAIVAFDNRNGGMVSAGDPRVAAAMDKHFPGKDVVQAVLDHGVDVQFSDPFSREVYYGELERHGSGIQPDGITATLFPYQATAVAQILQRTGMGLFLSPGLGKTLIGISVGAELLRRGDVDRVVVTPPASVSTQWCNEILRFVAGATPDDVVQIKGSSDKRARLYEAAQSASWMVVHHDILKTDSQHIDHLVEGQFLIIDEAHKGANFRAARSKRMREMASLASRRLAMTGTPVLNEVTEWYNVLGQLAVPGCLADAKAFVRRYQHATTYGRTVAYEGFRRLDELAERSFPHFIRWTKDQVAQHLAPLDVRHMHLQTSGDYRAALVRAHTMAQEELAQQYEDLDVDGEDVAEMTSYGMLRALCSSPELLRRSTSDSAQSLVSAGLIPDGDGPKLDTLRHMAQVMQDSDERLVVFTYSRTMAELIAERLTQDGVKHVTFHGQTSQKDRDKAVEAFTSTVDNPSDLHDNPTVFVATDAAAEGLNLGVHCATLVNFDLPWTAGRLEQRSNRIHRVDGTHSSYLVINMTLAGTVEDSILRKVESKASIADVLFGERSAQEVTGRRGKSVRIAVRDSLRAWKQAEVHMESTPSETDVATA